MVGEFCYLLLDKHLSPLPYSETIFNIQFNSIPVPYLPWIVAGVGTVSNQPLL